MAELTDAEMKTFREFVFNSGLSEEQKGTALATMSSAQRRTILSTLVPFGNNAVTNAGLLAMLAPAVTAPNPDGPQPVCDICQQEVKLGEYSQHRMACASLKPFTTFTSSLREQMDPDASKKLEELKMQTPSSLMLALIVWFIFFWFPYPVAYSHCTSEAEQPTCLAGMGWSLKGLSFFAWGVVWPAVMTVGVIWAPKLFDANPVADSNKHFRLKLGTGNVSVSAAGFLMGLAMWMLACQQARAGLSALAVSAYFLVCWQCGAFARDVDVVENADLRSVCLWKSGRLLHLGVLVCSCARGCCNYISCCSGAKKERDGTVAVKSPV